MGCARRMLLIVFGSQMHQQFGTVIVESFDNLLRRSACKVLIKRCLKLFGVDRSGTVRMLAGHSFTSNCGGPAYSHLSGLLEGPRYPPLAAYQL